MLLGGGGHLTPCYPTYRQLQVLGLIGRIRCVCVCVCVCVCIPYMCVLNFTISIP